jgi:hypothetical protein
MMTIRDDNFGLPCRRDHKIFHKFSLVYGIPKLFMIAKFELWYRIQGGIILMFLDGIIFHFNLINLQNYIF